MRKCTICGKKSQMTWRLKKLRGKYHRTVKKRKYPNLQWVRVPLDVKKKAFLPYAGKRILVCTKCMKALSKVK